MIQLNHAELNPTTELISTLSFTNVENIINYVESRKDLDFIDSTVYLCFYRHELIVTEDLWLIKVFINALGRNDYKGGYRGCNVVNIHEFESYEEAYESALDLMEEDPLCYRKEEKFKINVKFTTPN